MTRRLHFGVLILFLAWSAGAYDKVYRRTILKRTSLQGVISNLTAQNSQQIVTNGDGDAIASSTGNVSTKTSHLTGHHEKKQGDQRSNSTRGRTGPIRNMIQGRKRTIPETATSLSITPQENQPGKPMPPTRALSASLGSLNVLASFAGKNRVLVISAPRSDDGYYRLMMTLLRQDVYCEMAERHMQQIVMFHQEGETGGKVRRVNSRGQVSEQPLDPALVPRLMTFLKLEEGKFHMVLLKKNLHVEERYPYPVRLEAMYEAIDQSHMRKLEKSRQRGFVQRCRVAGVEGQLIEAEGPAPRGTNTRENGTVQRLPTRKVMERPALVPKQTTKAVRAPTTSAPAQGNTTTGRTNTKQRTTTTKPTAATTKVTTAKPTVITKPTTTTTKMTTAKPTPITKSITATKKPTPQTKPTTTTTTTTTTATAKVKTTPVRKITATTLSSTTTAETSRWNLGPPTTGESPSVLSINRNRGVDQLTTKSTSHPITESHDLTGSIGRYKNQYEHTTDPQHKQGNATSATQLTHENEEDLGSDPTHKIEAKENNVTSHNAEREKETDKAIERNTAAKKRTKAVHDGDRNVRGRKPGKKGAVFLEKYGGVKLAVKQPNVMRPLASFFNAFDRRRRLLVITAPSVENRMFTQQRDEYLEQVCEMAVRKISIIVIFGTWNNGTMNIDHFQLEQEQPPQGVPHEDLTNQPLIKALRKELGMTFNDYYMVLTDFDMKVKQEYEVPIAMKAVFDYIDTFPSRIMEMEQQKKQGLTCKREDNSRSLENFLSRFRWRRRLFVISAPEEEEWAYQQQLHALTSQACNLGLRHMSTLKLFGKKMDDMGGVLELYPINGSATVEREDLSASLVKDIRNYFQISPEYFSMLLVGKDGNVKSWYPSPMWSMSIIYDLVDSMQLRRQEMAIQQSLGMRCPEDEYGHHSYHGSDQDGYQARGYGY